MTVHANPQTLPIVFQFKDTPIRTIMCDEEPWFVAIDVCRGLEIAQPASSLRRLDDDEKGVHTMHTPGGAQDMTIISEPGVYRLVFTSRTQIAEDFKRWLAHEVIPAIRRSGTYASDDVVWASDDGVTFDGYNRWTNFVINERLKFAERVAGPQAASLLYHKLGLTAFKSAQISRVVETPQDDPNGCLRHLFRCQAQSTGTVGSLLDLALRDEASRSALRSHGIIVDPGVKRGFVAFADTHPFLRQAFASTQWAGEWKKALIFLDGAVRTKKTLPFNGASSLAVLVPRETIMNLRNPGAL